MKEAPKKTTSTTKPAVKVKDIAPSKDAKGGKHHSGPEHAMKSSRPSAAK